MELMPWFLVLISDRRLVADSDSFEFKDECVLEALMTTVSLIPAQSSFEASSFPYKKFTTKSTFFSEHVILIYDTLVRGEFQNEPFRRLGAILPQLGDNWLRVRSADGDTPLRFELRFDRPECGVAHGLFRFQKMSSMSMFKKLPSFSVENHSICLESYHMIHVIWFWW